MTSYEYNGRQYYWSGRSWLDEHYIAVCGSVALELCQHFPVRVKGLKQAATLRHRAVTNGQSCLNLLAEKAMTQSKDPAVLANLVGLMRDRGLQSRALTLTWGRPLNGPFLVARAACWCDLGEYDKARRAAQMALSMGSGEYATAVLRRIEKEAS